MLREALGVGSMEPMRRAGKRVAALACTRARVRAVGWLHVLEEAERLQPIDVEDALHGTSSILGPAAMVYAEGPNYRFEIVDSIARCRVWRRSDLDSAEGARCAEMIGTHARALTAGGAGIARAIVLDLREAPAVSGPRTLKALGELMEGWEQVKRPVAVVVAASPIQALQFRRLVAQCAPRFGATFTDFDSAVRWAAEARSAGHRR